MSLEDKIRALIESMETDSIAEASDEIDYASMSDADIEKMAESAGLEEMIVYDGEGSLANKDEIIAALETLDLEQNEAVVTEAEGDDEEEAPAEDEEMPMSAEGDEEMPAEGDEEPVPAEEDEPAEDEEPEVTVVIVSKELESDEDEDDEEKEPEDEDIDVKDEQFDKMVDSFKLSNEGKEQVRTVFESTLKMHAKALQEKYNRKFAAAQARLDAQLEARLTEAKQSASDDLAKLVDGFLTEATDQWIVENALPLEMSVRTELAEQFIDGMKVLFKEHYIDVPDEKLDLLKAQEEKIAAVEATNLKLQESLAVEKKAVQKAKTEATILRCAGIVSEAAEGLTSLEKTRFEKLVEEVDFIDVKQFARKVSQLRESFKATSQPSVKRRAAIVERVVRQHEEEAAPKQLTEVEVYAQALNSI